MRRPGSFAMGLCIAAWLVGPAWASDGQQAAAAPALGQRLSAVSVPFVENVGQLPEQVAFAARTFAGTVWVTTRGQIGYGLSAASGGLALRESCVGAGQPVPRGAGPSPIRISSFVGSDPARWRSDVPAWSSVRLGQPWPGIALELRAGGDNVEKLLTIAPGACPDDVRLRIEGARDLRVDEQGRLVLETGHGDACLTRPVAWQEGPSGRSDVAVEYTVEGQTYGFRVGAYDASLPLVIDPLLASTFLGGTNNDIPHSVAVGPDAVYVGGYTASLDFPTTPGSYDPDAGPELAEAFVSKLSLDLTTLLASTTLGGTDEEHVFDLTVSGDDVYVTGRTHSDDFPVTPGAYDDTHAGGSGIYDAFVARLSNDLSTLEASTFLGGNSGDFGHEIEVTAAGVHVAGHTASIDFPATPGAFDTSTSGSSNDAFVALFDTDLTTLVAATFLGGSNSEAFVSMDVAGGDVYLTGYTRSTDFPATGWDTTLNGSKDVFVARLAGDLGSLVAATYLGGSSNATTDEEEGLAIAVSAAGDVYVTGWTIAGNFPVTVSAHKTVHSGPDDWYDTFVSRFTADLLTLTASTFLGGDDDDVGRDLFLTGSSIFVLGDTESDNFPTFLNPYDASHNGHHDIYVARLKDDLTLLTAGTYLGGTGGDEATAMAAYSGSLFVTGTTYSEDYPVLPSNYDPSWNGGFTTSDGVLSRITQDLAASGAVIGFSPAQVDFGNVDVLSVIDQDIQLTNAGTDPVNVLGMSFDDGTHFSVDGGGAPNACGSLTPVILPGGQCAIRVSFGPLDTGSHSTTLHVLSDDPNVPDFPIALQGVGGSGLEDVAAYLLPKNVRIKLNTPTPEKSRLTMAGFFDTGPDPVDFSGAATLTIGARSLDIPAMIIAKSGKARYSGQGLDLIVGPSKSGSSKGRFKLRLVSTDVAGLDLDGELEFNFNNADVDAGGSVQMEAGRYKLGPKKGSLVEPTLYVRSVRARLREAGRDALKLIVGRVMPTIAPPAAPDVTVGLGEGFEGTIPGDSFVKQGETFRYKPAAAGMPVVVLDYRKGLIKVRGQGMDLGAFPDGAQSVLVKIGLDTEERSCDIRMVRKKAALRY